MYTAVRSEGRKILSVSELALLLMPLYFVNFRCVVTVPGTSERYLLL